MDLQCPGRMSGARDSKLVPCPACGRSVEIFSDEERVLCRCGARVFREAKPACFQWCPAADRCMGLVGSGAEQMAALPSLKPQESYQQAFTQALEQLRTQDPQVLAELGARQLVPGRYELDVLDGTFVVDLEAGRVTLAVGEKAPAPASPPPEPRLEWRILALHYLAARPPWKPSAKWVSFADLPEARGYEPVYRARVIGRLCATAGRDRQTFAEACRRLRAAPTGCGDEGFVFQVFPRLAVAVTWYAGDEEIRPGASLTYPENIGAFLSAEDVVVLAENLVGRLQGRGWLPGRGAKA